MKIRSGARGLAVLMLGLCLAPVSTAATTGQPAPVERAPAVAGQFYPGEKEALTRALRAYLDHALPPRDERPLAMIAPHAGYHYSGQIAADAWRQAARNEYDLVVILGANHAAPAFRGVSVFCGGGYRTPLGLAPIDRDVAQTLSAADERFAWRPEVHTREHSVEVHVPFAQFLFPEAKIVTAVVGSPDPALCAAFGKSLARALADRRALIVASSDLSHYPAHDDAVAADHATLAAMATLDNRKLVSAIDREMQRGREGLSTCACGQAPVMAAIEAAVALGATHARVISYANSGDVSIGDPSRVVGYGAVSVLGGEGASDTRALNEPAPSAANTALSAAEQAELLAFARSSIERWLNSGTLALARGFGPTLRRKQGVFVTLKKNGELRGCIGHRDADRPLGEVVGAMALAAAFNDRRFQPVRAEEMDEIRIEISLLGPLTPLAGIDQFEPGRDGIYLRKDGRAAIFLPEVAVEQGWSRQETAEQLCRKAGLPAGSWRDGAELFTFRTVPIHEAAGAGPGKDG